MNRRWHWFVSHLLLTGIFRIVLPVAARMPLAAGMAIASALGKVCGRLDLDWRTLALRTHYVAERTGLAYQEISPGLSEADLASAVSARFMNSSREELEGHWFALHRADECYCEFEGLEPVRELMDRGQGVMLLTLHFDATLMGVVQLGRAGLKLNLMTSDVVEDPRVAPVVRHYFARKYAGIQSYLNGGGALHVETHLKAFYSGMRRGVGGVVLGEAPTGQLDEALFVDFLGRRRAIAPGAVRIAEKMGAPMAAFVCLREACGYYRVLFSPVCFPSAEAGHADSVPRLFAFLDAQVRRYPERWWAADQLPNFINVDDDHGNAVECSAQQDA